MPMPTDVPVIDLMLAVPNDDTSNFYDFIRPLLMDEQSRQMFKMPAQYMFKDLPKVGKRDDYIAYTLEKMDEFNMKKPCSASMKDSTRHNARRLKTP